LQKKRDFTKNKFIYWSFVRAIKKKKRRNIITSKFNRRRKKKRKRRFKYFKIGKKKKKERNKYEDIGHILLKLSKEERAKLYNRLYPKVEDKDNEEDEDDKFYPLDDSKKVPMRSDYGIFIISN
jgi:hypothetical protein